MTQSAPPVNNEESLLKDDSSTNKSTKDSIMALYTGSGNNATQQPQMYGVPGGMYIQQQPQMQKNPTSMYNSQVQTPYHPQLHVMPMHMQQQHLMQHPTPHQQRAQLSQVQQQMQHLKLQKNPQMPFQQQQQSYQQPNMYSNNMFTQQQAMNNMITQQQSMHYQHQQQSQFISTGPSNNMFPVNGMPSSGHTFNNQLWK